MKPTVAGILCVLTLSRISAVSVNAADYTVVDLGPGTGVAINNSGNVVRNHTNQAFFHRGNSIVPIIPNNLDGGDFETNQPLNQVSATDVSDANIVVGSGITRVGANPRVSGAFWWSESENKVQLFFDYVGFRLAGLNSSGWAIGSWGAGAASGQFVPNLEFGWAPGNGNEFLGRQ